MPRVIPQADKFHRRLKPIAAYWVYCDECGKTSKREEVMYCIGVGMRDVQLCMACALALHDEAGDRAVEHLLLERF